MRPYEIRIEQSAIDSLRDRLTRAEWPGDFANDDWRYGVPEPYLHELISYWSESYDWRAHEAEMNRYEHFVTRIDDIPIHFMRIRGEGPDPKPLILSHGWPWTFWDFRDVIGRLTNPVAYGAPPSQSFDLIIPSLPGFGFSSPLRTPGVTFHRTADLWHRLMTETLGYERYCAHGGDWGALVTAVIGHKYPEHLFGVHESLPGFLGLDYRALKREDFGVTEEGWYDHAKAMEAKTASHLAVHSLDPQTLAYALSDSPIGLAAWILERRRAWSDCDGNVERCFSKDDLLTTISLYWFTGTIGTSIRFYWENARNPWQPSSEREPAVTAPSAFAIFPKDVLLVPRRIARQYANVERWTVMPAGGHFAAAEQPELLADDIRSFFSDLN